MNPRERAREVAGIGALAITYFVLAELGLALDAVAGFATLVWPPSGIALAALLPLACWAVQVPASERSLVIGAGTGVLLRANADPESLPGAAAGLMKRQAWRRNGGTPDLRHEPRYQALLERMGLPEEWRR